MIFTILYGNYYPPHEEFKLICAGKFVRRTCVIFTQQYGKNRQRCQQNTYYYAVWHLLLHFYREFPSKTLSVWNHATSVKTNKFIVDWKHKARPLFDKSKHHLYQGFILLIRINSLLKEICEEEKQQFSRDSLPSTFPITFWSNAIKI